MSTYQLWFVEPVEDQLELSISVEASVGFDWPTWKRYVVAVEQLGFSGLYLSDHFNTSGLASASALEPLVALTYLADHSTRIHFGTMVSPLSFRDPVFLARQAAAIDALSEGRMIVGVGAGWNTAEHTMFGYNLGDVGTRMDRLGEGLAVLTALLHTETPQQVEGRFFRLHEAVLAGPRLPGSPPILIGGSGPKRTIPLVARYGDIWNAQLVTPDEFQQRSTLLDELLVKVGRQPSDVKRTITLPLFCGRDDAELNQRAALVRRMNSDWASVPIHTIFESLRPHYKSLITGSPEVVVEQIRAYAAAGATEIIIQWANLDDIEGLRLLAEQVLPHVGTLENVG